MGKLYSTTYFVVNKNQTAKVLNVILSNSLTYLNAEFLKNEDLKITILSSKVSDYERAFK